MTSHQVWLLAKRNATFDRWFFSSVAIAMIVVATAGFLPSLIQSGGRRAPISFLAAAHGAASFGWLLIYLVQGRLIATGRVVLHRRVGFIGTCLLALMVPLGYATTARMVQRGFDLSGDLKIDHDPTGESVFPFVDIAVFGLLAAAALANVRQPEVHKRLMLFANISLMAAPLAHLIGHTPSLAALPSWIIMIPISMFLLAAIARDYYLAGKVEPLTLGLAAALFVSGPLRAGVIGPSTAWHRIVTLLLR